MMKNKYATIGYETINIGDEIQSVAAKRLLLRLGEKSEVEIDREKLNSFTSDEKVNLICNGWFMEKPDCWPPSDSINPLFISMHISHEFNATKLLTQEKYKEYYKKMGPIGCRDKHTYRLLQSHNIDSYFSGCMTLTLQNPYTDDQRTNEIVLADPLFNIYPYSYRDDMAKHLVPEEFHKDIINTYHRRDGRIKDAKERVKDAEDLLDIYARAKVVITSRIHVALPCLAFGTPVIFINAGYNSDKLSNRFEGLVGNMRSIDDSHFPLSKMNPIQIFSRVLGVHKMMAKPKVIDFDWANPPKNPIDISHIRDGIVEKVQAFIEVNKKGN